VSPSAIGRRKKAEKWVRAVPLRKQQGSRAQETDGERPTERRRAMVRRLLDALDKRLTLLEARMAQDGELGVAGQSAADAERDARTLTGLGRLYAKLVELDDAARADACGKTGKSRTLAETSDDADRLRRDLALRLQRLNQARDA
jgi:hypothetical protein